MSFFNNRTNTDPANAEVDPNAPAKKSDAELLAESLTNALKPLQDSISALSTRQEQFEQRFQPKPQAEQAEARPQQFASVFEDEEAAINQRVAAALGPVLRGQLEMQAQINKERVIREYENKGFGATLNQFADKINGLIDTKPLAVPDAAGGFRACRGDVNEIKAAINQVIGEAAAQAGFRFDGKTKTFFIESAGGGDNSGNTGPVGDGLTEKQRKMFNRMGIPIAEAQKTISKLEFVS